MNGNNNDELNELVGGDMNSSGGDKTNTNDSEIETGPIEKPFNDKSYYEKGVSTTTDKVFGRYRQNIPWFAVYSYGGRAGGAGRGLPDTMPFGGLPENAPKTIKKKTVEEKIEDLVKKAKDSEVRGKNYNSKFDNIINNINHGNFTEEEIEEINKALTSKKDNKKRNIDEF